MIDSGLTPQQIEVIDALSFGASLNDAAIQAGVNGKTAANWRRSLPQFQAALAHAQYDRALWHHEGAEALAGLAFQTLRDILADPKASPSVRLKAAIFVIEKATVPPPPDPNQPVSDAAIPDDEVSGPAGRTSVLEDRQPGSAKPAAQKCVPITIPPTRRTMHKDAQNQPYLRPDPKIGRNQACPCGSGRKHKHCCLGKPRATAA
jgi:hypothetical protein